MLDISFYNNKRVLVTGHTGFKGTWLCTILKHFGAIVAGYSLVPPTNPSLFEISNVANGIKSFIGDIRDFDSLRAAFDEFQPEIVFHLAAQPIVRDSYINPLYTFETNVIGTANILETIRVTKTVKSFVNVTTDKVYENKEWEWGYRESDTLNGQDPYSNSKSCSELVTESYKKSFFNNDVAISTARAGNVIGGGDFAPNRIIPDCIRSVLLSEEIIVRNPHSVRPYQHVLDPLFAYLLIAEKQYKDKAYSGCYNIGPDETDCVQTGFLVDLFVKKWGNNAKWISRSDDGPHEANYLKLDCSRFKKVFGWQPVWKIEEAIDKVIEWTHSWVLENNIDACMIKQIDEFVYGAKK